MGSLCSTPELEKQNAINKKIEKDIQKEQNSNIGDQKLLLLGTGECGKSTVLKQMIILHKEGFSESDRAAMREIVYSNIIQGMTSLLRAREKFHYDLTSEETEMDSRRILSLAEGGKDTQPFTSEVFASLKRLWTDRSIQKTFARRSEFQIAESVEFFMEEIDRIHEEKYLPSATDVLHIRVPTTGVNQVVFPIKGCNFRVFDVGGQRSERRKWIHLFDDVHALIYISAISEYNQMLAEDRATNRLQESIDLFHQICNCRWFRKAAMILFMNKRDLFEEKLKTSSIKVLFTHYEGPNTYRESADFVRNHFAEQNEHKSKKLYMHETCATDTDQVAFVIDSVVDLVIGKNLRGTGME